VYSPLMNLQFKSVGGRMWHNLAVNWTASTLRVPAASYFER
jgi:hypothetical protein